MPVSEADALEALLISLIDAAAEANADEDDTDGGASEEDQDRLDQLAALADDPEGLAELLGEEGGADADTSPARLAADDSRSPTESASPLVDAIIDRGAAAGIAVSEEVRRKVRAAVKKKFGRGKVK